MIFCGELWNLLNWARKLENCGPYWWTWVSVGFCSGSCHIHTGISWQFKACRFVRERWKRRSMNDKWQRRRCHSASSMNIRLTDISPRLTSVNSTSSNLTALMTPLHQSDQYFLCLRSAALPFCKTLNTSLDSRVLNFCCVTSTVV